MLMLTAQYLNTALQVWFAIVVYFIVLHFELHSQFTTNPT